MKIHEEIGYKKRNGPFHHNQLELVDKDEFDKLFTIQDVEPHLNTSDSSPDTLDEPIVYDCACDYVCQHPENIIHCVVRLNTDIIGKDRHDLVERHRKCSCSNNGEC